MFSFNSEKRWKSECTKCTGPYAEIFLCWRMSIMWLTHSSEIQSLTKKKPLWVIHGLTLISSSFFFHVCCCLLPSRSHKSALLSSLSLHIYIFGTVIHSTQTNRVIAIRNLHLAVNFNWMDSFSSQNPIMLRCLKHIHESLLQVLGVEVHKSESFQVCKTWT